MLYLLLILFPVAMAALCFILRRHTGLVIAAAIATLLTQIAIVTQIPLDDPVRLLGITLTLSPLSRLFLQVFLSVGALLFVGAFHLPHGENFVAIALVILAQVCAILLLQNLYIVSLLLTATGLAAILAIVDLPSETSALVGVRSLAAALKYLVLMVVAGALLYIAYVLTDIFRPGELPGRLSLGRFIFALLAVGFALRLALIPFHAWLPDLVDNATPLVSAWVIIMLNTTSLLVMLLTLQSFPALLTEAGVGLTIARFGALGSVLLAGIVALNQSSMRRTLAYLLLYDYGMVFYGVASVSVLGLTGAVFTVFNQTLAITLIFVSLGLLERPDGRPSNVVRRDLLRRWPVAGAGLVCGSLALLGVPPFSGFASKVFIYQSALEYSWFELIILLLSTVIAGVAFARLAYERLLGPSEERLVEEPLRFDETEIDRPVRRRLAPEPRSTAALTVVLLVVCLGIGFYPQPVLAVISEAISGLAFVRSFS